MRSNLRAILACDSQGGIARNGVMPWPKNKKDLAHFQKLTRGRTVIMGRKTWQAEDMPSPLPRRKNIVLTTTPGSYQGAEIQTEISETWLTSLLDSSIVYVIGGAGVFHQLMAYEPAVINLTKIAGNYDCDTFIDLDRIEYEYTLIESVSVDNLTTFETYMRKS